MGPPDIASTALGFALEWSRLAGYADQGQIEATALRFARFLETGSFDPDADKQPSPVEE